MSYKELQCIDLEDGIRGVIVGIWKGSDPPAYLVEIFLAPDSMGDDVITMHEDDSGALVVTDPNEFERVRRLEPNLFETWAAKQNDP